MRYSDPYRIRVGLLTAHISRRAAGVWEVIHNLGCSLEQNAPVHASVWGLEAGDTGLLTKDMRLDQCHAYKVIGPQSFGYSPELGRGLGDAHLDLLHTHGAWMYPSYASYQWGRRSGKPVMISPHGMLDPWALRHSRWKKLLMGLFFESQHFKGSQCIHALCEEEADGIRRYGVRSPICVAPNGVFTPESAERHRVDWIEDIARGRNILLFLGRLHPKKGLHMLIPALGKLKRQGHREFESWSTFIVGSGDDAYERSLKSACEAYGLESNVHFLGARFDREKCELLQAADSFVLPSKSEGLPVAVLEAWSYGVPCVLTPECHLNVGFEEGAALRIDAQEDSIARGLGQLFDASAVDRVCMGAYGRALVKRQFSWESVAARIAGVYDWLLGGGDRPECVIK